MFKSIREWMESRRASLARREFLLGYYYAAGCLLHTGYIALIYLSNEADGVYEGTKYGEGILKAIEHFKLPVDERFF